jgi:hypothetical protein
MPCQIEQIIDGGMSVQKPLSLPFGFEFPGCGDHASFALSPWSAHGIVLLDYWHTATYRE